MKPLPSLFTCALAALFAITAPATVDAGPKNCPPGLAKKANGCTPPGLAKKRADMPPTARPAPLAVYEKGEVISRRYVVIEYPNEYGLDTRRTYYRVGDQVYQVDEDTGEVLALLGAIEDLLD